MSENSADLINKIQDILTENTSEPKQVVEVLGSIMVNFGAALNGLAPEEDGAVSITQDILQNIQLRYYKDPNIADAMMIQGISMLKQWDLTKEEGQEAAERMKNG